MNPEGEVVVDSSPGYGQEVVVPPPPRASWVKEDQGHPKSLLQVIHDVLALALVHLEDTPSPVGPALALHQSLSRVVGVIDHQDHDDTDLDHDLLAHRILLNIGPEVVHRALLDIAGAIPLDATRQQSLIEATEDHAVATIPLGDDFIVAAVLHEVGLRGTVNLELTLQGAIDHAATLPGAVAPIATPLQAAVHVVILHASLQGVAARCHEGMALALVAMNLKSTIEALLVVGLAVDPLVSLLVA